jgi:hypothetical protein
VSYVQEHWTGEGASAPSAGVQGGSPDRGTTAPRAANTLGELAGKAQVLCFGSQREAIHDSKMSGILSMSCALEIIACAPTIVAKLGAEPIASAFPRNWPRTAPEPVLGCVIGQLSIEAPYREKKTAASSACDIARPPIDNVASPGR